MASEKEALQGAEAKVEDKASEGDQVAAEKASVVGSVRSFFERFSNAVASAQSSEDEKQAEEMTDSVLSKVAPMVHFAVQQAQGVKSMMAETTDVAVRAACDQIGELQDSTTTHYYYAKDMFWKWKREYKEHEDAFFGVMKDGVKKVADSPPLATALGISAFFVLFRRPRRFLFRHTLGRFRSDEARFSNAKEKTKDLRMAYGMQLNEMKKLEERCNLAECEYTRGRSKLEAAGGQIRSLVRTMYKTENQAKGLLANLRELPGKDALQLRAEVASTAAEVKQQRSKLDRRLYKIANYNIPV